MSFLTNRIPTRLRGVAAALKAKQFCKMMNDPLEYATGLEKKILLAERQGNTDPFNMQVLKRGPGTKDCPNLIPSAFDGRLVGCICEEDQTYIQYMWLHKGQPKRCECGYWFKLVEEDPL